MTVLRRLLWLVPLLASPVSAQEVSGQPEAVIPAALANGPARTLCVAGKPITQVAGPLPPDVLEQLLVHEAVHRRQLAGDCESRLALLLADPYRHADAEAEAGCAQFNASVADQVHRTFELGNLRGWLYARFPGMSRDTLNLLVARRCELWTAS